MECCRASQKLGQRAPPFGLEVRLSHCGRFVARRNDRNQSSCAAVCERPEADILKAALFRPRAQCARLVRSSVVGVGDEASALTKSQRAYRRSFETLEEMQRFVVDIDSPF